MSLGTEARGDSMDLNTLLNTDPWDWPEDASELLLETLVEKPASEADRLIAADLAGNITAMNDELANVLVTIVGSGDESDELRAKAALSLGPVLELADQDGFEDIEDVPITEPTFHHVQHLLHKQYLDESTPKEVRRRILEAAVRAPQDWHTGAISRAYSSADRDWKMTAVFAMSYIRGFEDQILEALNNGDPEICYQAVTAAANWELESAWPRVVALLHDPSTPKPLLLATIEAAANICPQEAQEILVDFVVSRDEDIVETAHEAIATAQALTGEADAEEGMSDGEWVN